MAEPAVIDQDAEATRVYRWRVCRFLELGFTLRQARRLADGTAGWHEAEALLMAGCPPDLVFDLLS
jgi:hypothetical protein